MKTRGTSVFYKNTSGSTQSETLDNTHSRFIFLFLFNGRRFLLKVLCIPNVLFFFNLTNDTVMCEPVLI